MPTTYYELADLVTGTLNRDIKGKISNINPTLLRSYPAANRLMRKSVVWEKGGMDVRWRVNVSGNTSARHFGPYHTVDRTQGDNMKTASMQLRNDRADFSFDVLEEEMNQGPEEVVDVIKNRRQNCKIALTEMIENEFWTYVAIDDEEDQPHGILNWLPYCTSAGFVGTVASGHTTVGALNPSTYTGWKTYGDVWVAATDADLFLKMRLAFSKTHFMAPLTTMLIQEHGTPWQWGLYMNLDTLMEFEDACKHQNDNVTSTDLDWINGRAMFRRTPAEEVPALDSNTRDPVFGVNWGQFNNVVRRGWWMKEERVAQNADQPLVVSYDMYCIHQLIAWNRRISGFNISKAA